MVYIQIIVDFINDGWLFHIFCEDKGKRILTQFAEEIYPQFVANVKTPFFSTEPYTFYFQDPESPVMEGLIYFHDQVMFLVSFIVLFVGTALYSCVHIFQKREPVCWADQRLPERFIHCTFLEIAWTTIPAILLLNLAVPSFALLYAMEELPFAQGYLKCVGHQWYWTYEYVDFKVGKPTIPLGKTAVVRCKIEPVRLPGAIIVKRSLEKEPFERLGAQMERYTPALVEHSRTEGPARAFADAVRRESEMKFEASVIEHAVALGLHKDLKRLGFHVELNKANTRARLELEVKLHASKVEEAVAWALHKHLERLGFEVENHKPLAKSAVRHELEVKLHASKVAEAVGWALHKHLESLGFLRSPKITAWDELEMKVRAAEEEVTLELFRHVLSKEGYDHSKLGKLWLRKTLNKKVIARWIRTDVERLNAPDPVIEQPRVVTRTSLKVESYLLDGFIGGEYRRLLSVDNTAKIPMKEHIRVLVTSADVLHSWAIPSLGIKIDACPGRMNQSTVYLTNKRKHYGQCSELCGVNHGFMPVVLEAF